MTPAARVQATIEILDQWLDGPPIEKLLTHWGRSNRFAGSKDRAAVRDLTFDCLRLRGKVGAFGQGETGRLWAAAVLNDQGIDLADIFSGIGYGPIALSEEELTWLGSERPHTVFPDAAMVHFSSDLLDSVEAAFLTRGPVTLRVNTAKTTKAELIGALKAAGFDAVDNPVADTALTVVGKTRGLANADAFLAGNFELQDAGAQSLCAGMKLSGHVLDYCAGGGASHWPLPHVMM